jgi:hypothetical protein
LTVGLSYTPRLYWAVTPNRHAAKVGKVLGAVFVSLRRDKSGKKNAHLLSCSDSADVIKFKNTLKI